MSSTLDLLYNQLFVTPAGPTYNFKGQTVIVTGSNVNMGLEGARQITRLNAQKVIIAVRSTEKGEAAKADIEKTTSKQSVVEVWKLDLASYDSVKEFARRAKSLERLDAVVENAGIRPYDWLMAEDNESNLTVNVVSTILLALLLLPKLRETASKYNVTPRISIVSSMTHALTRFSEKSSPQIFEKLNSDKKADMMDRYAVSKLVVILYCRELAARMSENRKSQVTLNFLNPGFVRSNLNSGPGIKRSERILSFLFARKQELGGYTLVAGAAAGPESHGQYMDNGVVAKPSAWVLSQDGLMAQKKIWNELNEKLEKIQPGILTNI